MSPTLKIIIFSYGKDLKDQTPLTEILARKN